MHRILIQLLLVATCVLPSCRTYSRQYYLGSDDYVLATRDLGGGRRETYQLQARGTGVLRITTEYPRERPFLGFQFVEFDKAKAERRGLKPYCGLLVTGVYPGSAAAEAGVLAGDVVLSIAGMEVVYLEQVAKAEAGLRLGQEAAVKLVRGQQELDLSLATKLLQEKVTDSQEIVLEPATPTGRPFAGVTLRGIPAAWCERIFGEPRQAIVVTDVEVGSPAWLAGVRGGDVIDLVDGQPVSSAQELSQRIAEGGPAGQTMSWRVRRATGQFHEATVQLADYSGETNAWIPLIMLYQNGTFEDRWTIGPFGLLMSNRNHYLANSSVRRTETRNVFSALLGLFRVETTPQETKVRLLWVIKFDT